MRVISALAFLLKRLYISLSADFLLIYWFGRMYVLLISLQTLRDISSRSEVSVFPTDFGFKCTLYVVTTFFAFLLLAIRCDKVLEALKTLVSDLFEYW